MHIKLEGVSKTFGTALAVDKLDMEINDGELVCLLGPSGCGKSTTLSILAGLISPTQGKVYFDGKDVTLLDPEERDIGMVFQNYALYPHMTVEQNIAFPLKMQKIKREQRNRLVKEMLDMLYLNELKNRKPSELSGGQQQRVAIARALVKKPKMILLDEPFSNLDARLRLELRDEIRSLQQKLKITTVFVTHDQEEAMSISDRILILDSGVLQQYSSPKEMYTNPKNKFVAGFLGNPPINFIKCDYSLQTRCFNFEGSTIFSDFIDDTTPIKDGKILVGVRPEDIIISPDYGSIHTTIASVQPIGKEVFLRLAVGDTNLTAVAGWDSNYFVGQKIEIGIRKIHVFHNAD